jgi:hypothetical protein
MHYKKSNSDYTTLEDIISTSTIRGNHALLTLNDYEKLMKCSVT